MTREGWWSRWWSRNWSIWLRFWRRSTGRYKSLFHCCLSSPSSSKWQHSPVAHCELLRFTGSPVFTLDRQCVCVVCPANFDVLVHRVYLVLIAIALIVTIIDTTPHHMQSTPSNFPATAGYSRPWVATGGMESGWTGWPWRPLATAGISGHVQLTVFL